MPRPSPTARRDTPLVVDPPASRKQLDYLASLHGRLGISTPRVTTRKGASAGIEAAKRLLETRQRQSRVPRIPQDFGPTKAQMHDLRVLARRAGEPTPNPIDRDEAVKHLARLRSALP